MIKPHLLLLLYFVVVVFGVGTILLLLALNYIDTNQSDCNPTIVGKVIMCRR